MVVEDVTVEGAGTVVAEDRYYVDVQNRTSVFQWVHDGDEVPVSKQVGVSSGIGTSYTEVSKNSLLRTHLIMLVGGGRTKGPHEDIALALTTGTCEMTWRQQRCNLTL